MEETRRKSIDELVEKLKEEYSLENLDSLKKIAKDKRINIIDSNEVIVPFSYKDYTNQYWIGGGHISLQKNWRTSF